MVLSSLFEIISVGAVLPFLGVLTAPDQIYQHQLMQPFILFLGLTNSSQLILPLTIVFIAAALAAGAIRLILLYTMTRVSYAAGADISINIYQRTLYQDYSVHVARNSSEVINGIIFKTSAATGGVFQPALTIISSFMIMVSLMGTLLLVNATIALLSFTGFGLLYLGVIRYTKQHLKDNSKCISEQSTLKIKSLQEGLGGIRDVLIDGSQKFYCKLFRTSDLLQRRAAANNSFVMNSPRNVMEALGMVLIAIFAYIITQQGDISAAIPVLGTLALGAQRILPALQQMYGAYSKFKGARSSVEDVIKLLQQPMPTYVNQPLLSPIAFEQAIILKNLSFRYNQKTPWVLKDVNLKINKGTRIGFIGVTGSGKSTLIDIIMGLLSPSQGKISIDNQAINDKNLRAWQAHIAHVPQNIYLSDSTIEENIAFGVSKEKINHSQVKKAAKQAQITELIESWEKGYQTFVGERGIRLSGGQRQRIGIARALYKQANVLVFDEATSALDNKTEQAVMKNIEDLGKEITILIIAHRLTTLKGCDQIVELGKNHKVNMVSYEQIINNKN
ncbi:ABC transporter ATP-binding protein [Candidatus Woesearchaeota archaeon]|nr:ABC transporter ATP-binding protein [Candidatus Woesearchaeota archaeon]